MKNTNPKSFVAGFAFALLLFISFSFYASSEKTSNDVLDAQPQASLNISPQQANTYRSNYTTLNPSAIEAINLSVEQWEALNQLIKSTDMRDVAGFRMYFGKTSSSPNSSLVSIPYAIDDQMNELPPAEQMPMAQGFPDNFNSQCPPFCD